MILKDLSFANPDDNILFDEALFVLAEKKNGPEVLRFWESQQTFIVLGRIGREYDDLHVTPVLKDQIAVLRRTSGGGTVVQGVGCLNYALILNKINHPMVSDLRGSYQWISQQVIEVLLELGVRAVFKPISDMALTDSEKKFSGNAQRRGKNCILHHGTILYDFDLNLIDRYLQMPKEVPEYRQGRLHHRFVTNISIDPHQFKAQLARKFSIETTQQNVTEDQKDMLLMVKSKYNPFIELQVQ